MDPRNCWADKDELAFLAKMRDRLGTGQAAIRFFENYQRGALLRENWGQLTSSICLAAIEQHLRELRMEENGR